MLSYNDLNEVVKWPMELVIPTPDLSELHYAEIEEQGFELWFQHIKDVILVTGTITYSLKVVELEPQGHYFVVEVRAWFYELDVEIRGRLSCGRCGYLNLLLDYLLLLLFKFVNEV